MAYFLIVFVLILVSIIALFLKSSNRGDNVLVNYELPDFATVDPETNAISLNLAFEKSISGKGEYLVFDLETTGLPTKPKSTPDDFKNWPRVVQISWILFDSDGKQVNWETHYINQEKPIPETSIKIHLITDQLVAQKGKPASVVLNRFLKDVEKCRVLVAHNIDFDVPIIESELYRINCFEPFIHKTKICTMDVSRLLCKIPCVEGRGYKNPNLEEMMRFCFFPDQHRIKLSGLHDAAVDTAITSRCFFHLLENNYIVHDLKNLSSK